MALKTIIAPLAAALFASAVAVTPAGAAIFGGGGNSGGGSQSAAPSGGGNSGGGAFRGGGGGARSAPAPRSGSRSRGGRSYPSHRGSGHYRSYGGGGVFLFPWAGFGAPSPYYQEDDGYLVCRYRRVRYHGHWVRRRYCWREY